jgi:hypothetical protein
METTTQSVRATASGVDGDAAWDDLVDRLAVHDVRYLTGGSAAYGLPPRYVRAADAPADALIRDLANAPQARLRDALVALLFRHPEYAPIALGAADGAKGTNVALAIRVGVLAAAALRRYWQFTLDIYLPGQPEIEAEAVARLLDVPSPRVEYGGPCLAALAELLRSGAPFPFAYERGWQDAVRHVLFAMRADARELPA